MNHFSLAALSQRHQLIPLEHNGKRPTIKNWQNADARVTEAAKKHFETGKGNIGLVLNDTTLVIDIDPRNGGDISYLKLIEDHPDLAQPVTITTAGGGWHSYCTKPAHVKIRKQLTQYPGIDFLTKGCYVVTAPSNGTGRGWAIAETARYPLPELSENTLTSLFAPSQRPVTEAPAASTINPERLKQLLSHIDPESYRGRHDHWMQLMASAQYLCPDGADIFATWSTSDPEYAHDYDQIVSRYETFTPKHDNPITGRTLRKHLGKALPWFDAILNLQNKVTFESLVDQRDYLVELAQITAGDTDSYTKLWMDAATDPSINPIDRSVLRRKLAKEAGCSVAALDSMISDDYGEDVESETSSQMHHYCATLVIDSYEEGITCSNGVVYGYSTAKGCWSPLHRQDINSRTYEVLVKNISMLSSKQVTLTSALKNSIAEMVTDSLLINETDGFDKARRSRIIQVNTQTGTLTLDPVTKTFTETPHDRDRYLRNTCAVSFVREPKETPHWDALIDDTVSGPDAEKLRRQILAMIVETASNGALNARKAFLLYGGTASGKSLIIDLIEATLGLGNTSAVALSNFASRFALMPMATKGVLANLSSEMGAKEASAKVFKELVSGDAIEVDVKNSKPIHYNNRATLVFAGNQLPRIIDHSDATKDRLTILPLMNTKPEEERNRALHILLLEELDDIFSKAVLQYAAEYKKDGCFDVFQNEGIASRLIDRWGCENDSTFSWLAENIRESENPDTVNNLYLNYSNWAKGAGIKYPLTRPRFVSVLEDRFGETVRASGGRGFNLQVVPVWLC